MIEMFYFLKNFIISVNATISFFKMAFVCTLSQIKLLFGPLVIQLVWYILIHLSVGENGGSANIHRYSPPFR